MDKVELSRSIKNEISRKTYPISDDYSPSFQKGLYSKVVDEGRSGVSWVMVYITPHEIQTLAVPDMPILRAYVGCQCTNVVWPDLAADLPSTMMHHTLQAISQEIQPQYERGYRQTWK
jgi:hypothetical protein